MEHLLWNSGYWPSPNKSARVFAISYAVTKRKRMVKLFIYDYLYFIQAMLAILRIYLFPIRPRLFHSAFTFTMRSGWLKTKSFKIKGLSTYDFYVTILIMRKMRTQLLTFRNVVFSQDLSYSVVNHLVNTCMDRQCWGSYFMKVI